MGALYRDLVRKHSTAKGSARALLNVLADYANDDGFAWPGRGVLASDTGMSERNVTRCLQKLCDEGHLEISENGSGGRGRIPVYRIVLPEAKRVTSCHPLDEERVTSVQLKGDKLSVKGDKSVAIPSYARYEPQEPKEEPKREGVHSLPSRVLVSSASGRVTFKSRHVDKSHFDFDTGYISAGKGATAVEVYYERFDVQQNAARLNAIKEDDLVRYCKDLERLREVITAYSQTNYLPGNVRLILDWYRDGVPEKHKSSETNGSRLNGANFTGKDKIHEAAEASRKMLIASGKEHLL